MKLIVLALLTLSAFGQAPVGSGITQPSSGSGGPPTGAAGGALTGTYPNPVLRDIVSLADYTANGTIANHVAFNNAVAALPSTGGTVVIPAGSYVFTASPVTIIKPVLISCSGGATSLTFSGSSSGFVFDPGINLSSNTGITGCSLFGSGGGSIGVRGGVSNGAQGMLVRDNEITGFGTGLQFGSNTWLVHVEHNSIHDNGINMSYTPSWTNSGESMTFLDNTFAATGSTFTNNCVLINAPTQQTVFVGGAFDACQLVNLSQTVVIGTHIENPNTASTVPLVVSSSGNLTLIAPDLYVNSFSGVSSVVSVTGGSATLSGGQGYSVSANFPALVNVSGSANFTYLGGTNLVQNIGAVYTSTSSGQVSDPNHLNGPSAVVASSGQAALNVQNTGSGPLLSVGQGGGNSNEAGFYAPGLLFLTPYTPASSSAGCAAGVVAVDQNYIYVCTASNTWKRLAPSSF